MISYRHTSRLAWEDFVPFSAKLDRDILTVIEAHGERGIICAKIERQLGRVHQSVSGNLRHLVERGLVEPSGHYDLTPSRRSAMRWRIVKGPIPKPIEKKPRKPNGGLRRQPRMLDE